MLNPASLPSGTGNAQIVPAVAGKTIFLRGWAASEDTGTGPAKLQILDALGGNLIVPITLIAGASVREFVPAEPAAQGGSRSQPAGFMSCAWQARAQSSSTPPLSKRRPINERHLAMQANKSLNVPLAALRRHLDLPDWTDEATVQAAL